MLVRVCVRNSGTVRVTKMYYAIASNLCPDIVMGALAMPMKTHIFRLNSVLFVALTGLLLALGIAYSQAQDEQETLPPIDLADYLTGPMERGESPGLIAAVIDEHGVRAIGAAGLRRQGSRSPITVNDLVHIGSNTKAMTATMLATLVADGTFPKGWDTTIGDVFPKLAKKIHPKYRSVTLSQMIRMESGMPENPNNQWAYASQEDVRKRRYAIIRDSLKAPPAGPKGRHLYSNLSYMVAALLAEGRTGKSWETLMEERLFARLGMTTAGFGPPGTPRKVDQPWGHRRKGGTWKPRQFDNDPSFGPAGTVHLSIKDWAKFIQLWLPGRKPAILDRRTLVALSQAKSSSSRHTEGWYYTGGWFVAPRNWAGGYTLSHNGSNTYWQTTLWVAPNRNAAYLAAANSTDTPEGDKSWLMLDTIVGRLIQDGL